MKQWKICLPLVCLLGMAVMSQSVDAKSLQIIDGSVAVHKVVTSHDGGQLSTQVDIQKENNKNMMIPLKKIIREKELLSPYRKRAPLPNRQNSFIKPGATALKPYTQKAGALGPYIRVLISSSKSYETFTPNREVNVLNSEGKVILTLPAERAIIAIYKRGQIYINNKAAGTVATLVSKKMDGSFIINVDGINYRGNMILRTHVDSRHLAVINQVTMEEYIYGVVPAEAIPSWPMAALEAQAVAARTYALYSMRRPRGTYYDVERDTRSQVYNGMSRETYRTTEAIDHTRGQVMLYNNEPIDALFHADAGGYTEDSRNVWGNYVPYLRAVPEKYRNTQNQNYRWIVKTDKEHLEQVLRASGRDVGTLKKILLSTLEKRPMNVKDRTPSGRVIVATFIGTKSSVAVTGASLEAMLGLKSRIFDFYINSKPPIPADDLVISHLRSNMLKEYKKFHSFKKGNEPVYILGYGYGHGLGLSQWGAADMATHGPKNDRDYYKKILKHYYQGITIQKAY